MITSFFKNDSVLIFSSPDLTKSVNKKLPLGQIVYIYKQSESNNRFLIGKSPSLKGANIVMLGTRNLDEHEPKFINKFGIAVYSPDILNSKTGKEVAQEILQKLKDTFALFIHIDVDVLDPSESEGTYLPEPNGIRVSKLKEILSHLVSNHSSLGLSFSEYNPALDKGGRTKNIMMELLECYFSNEYTG